MPVKDAERDQLTSIQIGRPRPEASGPVRGPHFWGPAFRGRLGEGPDRAWDELSHRARLRLLRMHYESGVGHIGGNLSCLDLMLVLHHDVLRAGRSVRALEGARGRAPIT